MVHEEWALLAQKIGRRVSSRFANVEPEDISQEVYLYALNREMDFTASPPEEKVKELWKSGYTYAFTAENARLIPTDQAWKVKDIREMFEFAAEHGADIEHETSRWSVVAGIIAWGADQLSEPQRDLLFRKYWIKDELDPNEVRRVDYILGRLTTIINKKQRAFEGPGNRRVITNATANARLTLDD